METLYITVGNTVDLTVDIDNISTNSKDAKIEIYKDKKYPDGLQNLVETISSDKISDSSVQFIFDTDRIAPYPSLLYGRFFIDDNGKKINSYFKLKFTY